MTFQEKFIAVVKDRRKVFLIFFVALNIFALMGLMRIKINSDLSLFKPADSPAMQEYKDMATRFGSAEQLIFLVKSDQSDIYAVLKDFFDLQKKVEAVEGVRFANGPVPPVIPSGLTTRKVDAITAENSEQIFDYIESMGAMKTLYKREDGYYGLFTVSPEPDAADATARRLLAIFEDTGLEFYNSGDIYLQTSILDYIKQILLLVPPIAFIMILLIFRWRIGNFKGTILSVLPAGIGALWTMGFLGWASLELSVITVLTPIFTIVMGSADGLHFISHVQDEIKSGSTRENALSGTLEKVGWPMILTTLTTVAGFMSLLVIQSEPMRQLAFTASTGILLAGIATWVFLPVICIGLKNLGKSKTRPTVDPVTPALEKAIGWPALIITLALSIAFLPGIFVIKTDLNIISLYKQNTKVRQNIDKISEVTGGAIPLFIEFETEDDPLSPEIAVHVLSLERKLEERGVASKTVSIYDVFSTMNNLVFKAGSIKYPETAAKVNLMFMMFNANQPQEVRSTLLREEKAGRLIVFPTNLSNEVLETIQETVQSFTNDEITFRAVGMPQVMKEMNDRIIVDQVGSIFLAVVLVFLLMWLTLGSLKMALIGIVPLGTTLIALFGFMGYAGISLNIITSTMASITIGVGIDYSVHFTTLFKTFYGKHDSERAAIMAFEYVSSPVLANALGLALGLSALLLSPLKFHMYMSMLMWVTMLVSSIISLTFLPTILARTFSKKSN